VITRAGKPAGPELRRQIAAGSLPDAAQPLDIASHIAVGSGLSATASNAGQPASCRQSTRPSLSEPSPADRHRVASTRSRLAALDKADMGADPR